MRIHIKKNSQKTFFGKHLYSLSIKAELTKLEHQVINDHDLHSFLIYTSPAYDRNAQRHDRILEIYDDTVPDKHWLLRDMSDEWDHFKDKWELLDQAKKFKKLALKAFRLTVGDLISGDHFETHDLLEFDAVEKTLFEAVNGFEDYLTRYLEHDYGDEYLLEAEYEVPDGTPPEHWSPPFPKTNFS